MTKKKEMYQCMKCGNVVEVLKGGDGDLVCCGEPMQRMSQEEATPFLTPPEMKPGAP